MIQLINESSCDIGGLVLKVGQNIDYKDYSNSNKLTIGKLNQFAIAPNSDSVWMEITEIEDGKNKFWFSVPSWVEMYKAGLFSNAPKKTLINESDEPEDDDLPF